MQEKINREGPFLVRRDANGVFKQSIRVAAITAVTREDYRHDVSSTQWRMMPKTSICLLGGGSCTVWVDAAEVQLLVTGANPPHDTDENL